MDLIIPKRRMSNAILDYLITASIPIGMTSRSWDASGTAVTKIINYDDEFIYTSTQGSWTSATGRRYVGMQEIGCRLEREFITKYRVKWVHVIMGKVAEHLNVLGKMLIDHAFGTTYQDVEDEEE